MQEIKGHGTGVTEPEGTENSGDSLTELTKNVSLVCSTTNPEGRVGAVYKGESTRYLSLSVAMARLSKQKSIALGCNSTTRGERGTGRGVLVCFSPAMLLV